MPKKQAKLQIKEKKILIFTLNEMGEWPYCYVKEGILTELNYFLRTYKRREKGRKCRTMRFSRHQWT